MQRTKHRTIIKFVSFAIILLLYYTKRSIYVTHVDESATKERTIEKDLLYRLLSKKEV